MKNFAVSFFVFAFALNAKADFLPPNDLHLQDSLFADGGISEQEFNTVLDQIEALYAPIFTSHGATLRLERKWDDPFVNASANKEGNTWIVSMYGGLARRPEVTADGFALVACHEVGHHLGGFPFYRRQYTSFTNEGGSDYFSTQACSDLMWRNELEKNAASRQTVAPEAKKICDSVHQGTDDQNLCYRKLTAGFGLATLVNSAIPGQHVPVKFDTPNVIRVLWTKDAHPQAQCRLDTYVAGALCVKEFNSNIIPKSEDEMGQTSCTHDEGIPGARSRCWFKPHSRL
ncbi:MAG: hypothetical protein AB7T49_18060 [Oligoflexales bacterium]